MLLLFAQRCDIVAEPAREGERAAVATEVVEISNINMRFMSFNTASGMNGMQLHESNYCLIQNKVSIPQAVWIACN